MASVDERPRSPSRSAADGRAAYEEFYRATAKRLLDTALRLTRGDMHVATEATRMAYSEVWQRWPQRIHLPIRDNRMYVTKITANKIADHFRGWKGPSLS